MLRKDFLKVSGLSAAGIFFGSKLSLSSPSIYQATLSPLLVDASGNSIRSLSGWKKQRNTILRLWSDYLGVLAPNPQPPGLTIIREEKPEDLIRQFIEYENEPGERIRAYLLKPQHFTGKLPGVVALHSTSDNAIRFIAGVDQGKITPLGYRLAQMGFVVICPMCFLWRDKGDLTYEQQVERFQQKHPGSKGMARMLFDAQRAVDVLSNSSEVDNKRIGALGHSLGGKEAFYLGAFDDRIKVVVSNEGGIGIDFSNWDDPWYLGQEIHRFNHQHHEILALCAPKPFLLIGGDDADGDKSIPYIDAVKPVYDLYRKKQNIQLYNHGQGHNIVPAAEKLMYDWMLQHL